MVNIAVLHSIQQALQPYQAVLVAVTKNHSPEEIMPLYHAGHRVFGENRVQELLPKYEALPKDITWHHIGHLQSNKVKYIAPFVSLIHAIDGEKLLQTVNREAEKCNRVIDCLLQVHIAQEEGKFGFSPLEAAAFLTGFAPETLPHVRLRGLMGMATFTQNTEHISGEFTLLHQLYAQAKANNPALGAHFNTLSMGMSNDYLLALRHGSTMVRIGSLLFEE